MQTEILYTRPLDLPTGRTASKAITITKEDFTHLKPGEGCRKEDLGINVPHGQGQFRYKPAGGNEMMAILQRLTTEPDGQGEEVYCWVRII